MTGRTTPGRPEMFNFVNAVHKIKDLFSNMTEKDKPQTPYSLVIETDFEHEKYKDKLDSHIPGMNSYGTFDDYGELNQCQMLKNEIEEVLRIAREKQFHCEILFPCGLLSRVAQDVLRMAQDEPYGLRGCILFINLEEKNLCRRIARIDCDPATVATFELFLTLKEDNRGWCMLQKLFLTVKGCFKNTKWKTFPKILCSGFLLEKNKLYRSNH